MSEATKDNLLVGLVKEVAISTLQATPVPMKDIFTFNASVEAEKGGFATFPEIDMGDNAVKTFAGTYEVGGYGHKGYRVPIVEKYIDLNRNNFDEQSFNLGSMESEVAEAITQLVNGISSEAFALANDASKFAGEVVIATPSAMTADKVGESIVPLKDAKYKAPYSVVLNPSYHFGLVSDIADASVLGSADAIRNGKSGSIMGASVYESNGLAVGQKGFVTAKDAIAFACRGVADPDNVFDLNANIEDSKTGLIINVRRFKSPANGSIRTLVAIRYGMGVIRDGALYRIVTEATEPEESSSGE